MKMKITTTHFSSNKKFFSSYKTLFDHIIYSLSNFFFVFVKTSCINVPIAASNSRFNSHTTFIWNASSLQKNNSNDIFNNHVHRFKQILINEIQDIRTA